MGEVCIDDAKNAHQYWQTALAVRVGGKWRVLPIRLSLEIAGEAPNGYHDGRNGVHMGNVGEDQSGNDG